MEAQEFGQYRLQSLIGSGGMGEVCQAFDIKRDRVVALKLLSTVFSKDDEYQRRFRRESHAVARLREPHVIPIHDYGESNQRLFIDMRLVDGGQNIATILADQGPLAPARAVHLISQIADALDAAHADGLVHRDIKPSNVLVTSSDFVYVVDFGIAHSHTLTALTMSGTTVGTPDYMAPERFGSGAIDCRADVYSLACLLYECLTGARPFTGADPPSLMFAHLHTGPPKPSRTTPAVPAEFDEIVMRGLAKKPQERFGSAGKLAEAARAALAAAAQKTAQQPTLVADTSHRVGSPPALLSPPAVLFLSDGTPPIGDATIVVEPPISAASRNGLSGPSQPTIHSSTAGATAASHAASTLPSLQPVSPPPPRPRSSMGGAGARPGRSPRSRSILRVVSIGLAVLAIAIIATVLTNLALFHHTSSRQVAPPLVTADSPAALDHRDIPAITPSIAVPTVAASVGVGSTPGYIEVAPSGQFAYIANRDAGVITVLDTTINNVTATIPTPAGPPQYVAFTPDGTRAYVSIYNKNRTVNLVAVLDTATNAVIATIPVDKRPFALAVAPDQRSVWVPSHDTGMLDVIDTATNKIAQRIPVAPNPHWVTFSRDGRRVYTANHESNVVSVIDTATLSVVATVRVGTSPHSTAFSPDGTRVSVVNYDSNNVSVIDTATNMVVATIPVGPNPQDITYAPDGRYAYTANVDGGSVSVIDSTANTVTATIPVGDAPTSVGVLPNGRQAYVTNLYAGKVTILDIGR